MAPGFVLLATGPIERLYGGLPAVLRRVAGGPCRPLRAPARRGARPLPRPGRGAARAARPAAGAAPERVREALAPLPVTALVSDAGLDPAVARTLEGLGLARLGGLAALDRLHVRDRFGPEGERAWRLARGRRPATAWPAGRGARAVESLALPEAVATEQALDHALRVIVERLLARPERPAGASRAPCA